MFVPVVDNNNKPLMPTTPSRARKWIKSGKATPFWSNQIFCVRLNVDPSDNKTQDIVVGIDPGSKREALTIKSESHTYLNILSNAVTWVNRTIEKRKNARRARRFRKTPYRKNRMNRMRNKEFLAPSTKARWQLKLRIVNRMRRIFKITDYVVEDIKASTKVNQKKWNKSFSPLEVGKTWFYNELRKLGNLKLRQGYETFEMRNELGLNKSSNKLSDGFDSHNVDSWVLANWLVGGHTKPDNIEVKRMIPIQFYRRQLHYFQFSKGGIRKRYGGTMSLGYKKGSIVKYKKHEIYYIGGNYKRRIILHDLETGRIVNRAKVEEIKFLTYNNFR